MEERRISLVCQVLHEVRRYRARVGRRSVKFKGQRYPGELPTELEIFWDNGHVVEIHISSEDGSSAAISLGPREIMLLRAWLYYTVDDRPAVTGNQLLAAYNERAGAAIYAADDPLRAVATLPEA